MNTDMLTKETDYIKLISIPSLSKDVVRVRIMCDLPAKEHAKHPALIALYSDMLMRGTTSRSREEIAAALDRLGALLAIDAEGRTLSITLTVLEKNAKAAIQILTDILQHPSFPKGELAKAKKQEAQAYHEEEDDARTQAWIAFARAHYGADHPHHAATSKEKGADVTSCTVADLKRIHSALHTYQWTIGISAPNQSLPKLEDLFTRVHLRKGNPVKEPFASEPHKNVAHVYTTVPGKPNIDLYIGMPLSLPLVSRDFIAYSLGVDVLGKRGGFVGRLMSTVREKEGLTYGIYASIAGATATLAGYFTIWTFFTARDYKQGIASTMREVRKIFEKGVTDAELALMKEINGNQFQMAHGSDSGKLGLYVRAYHAGLDPKAVVARQEIMQSLTRKEVNAALRAHLNPESLVISGAGPIAPNGTPLEKA